MNEIITIGIPAFNEEEYISETILSLLNQDMTDWKAIISDNCSIDSTYEIVKEFSAKDKRITSYRHENHVTILDNFIFSLNRCESKYFVWLGAHDVFDKKYFDYAIAVLEKNKGVSMVYPKSIFIDKNGIQIAEADSDIASNGLNRYKRMCKIAKNLSCCTAVHGIFRSELLKKVPFKNTIGADHLVLFSAASYGELYELPFVGIKRRQIRIESPDEKKSRWEKEGLFKVNNNTNPYVFLVLEHFRFILQAEHLKLKEKLLLIINAGRMFKNKFNLSSMDFFDAFGRK